MMICLVQSSHTSQNDNQTRYVVSFNLKTITSVNYLIALGTRLVSNLYTEPSKSVVISRGTSSVSCRQDLTCSAIVAVSGK